MLGTFHLTSHALRRLHSNPRLYLPLWEKDPVAFLHEEARVDPPVTSVTGVLGTDVEIDIVEQGKCPFAKGTPYQLVISTANVDPNVFGGQHGSKKYATAFDPSRSHSETLSWNGRLEDVKEFKAPRGCPGYKLSMGLAKSIVGTFLPALETLPKPLTPGSSAARSKPVLDPASEAGLWTTKAALGKGLVDPNNGNTIGYKIGCSMWLVSCVTGIGYLLGQGLGAMSIRYLQYLIGQAVVSTGVIMDWPIAVVQGMLFAAMAYYLMYITAVSQKHKVRGHVLSLWLWIVWMLLAATLGTIILVFGHVSTLSTVTMLFYSVGAMLGLLTVFRFYSVASEENKFVNNSDSEARFLAARYGLLGGCLGVANLVLVFIPGWGLFLSRVFDSVFYVPLMLRCIKAMDSEFKDTDVALPNGWCIRISMTVITTVCAILIGLSSYGLSASLSHDLCVWEAYKPADLSICTNTPMSRVDTYGRVMFTAVKQIVTITDEEVKKREDPKIIMLPKHMTMLQQKEAIVSTGWNIPIQDEDTEEESFFFKMTRYFIVDVVLRSSTLFPIHDNPERWNDIDQARRIMTVAGGNFLPPPVMDWSEIDKASDEAVSAMCFAGMAAPRVVRLPDQARTTDPDAAAFKVDFSELVALDVRPGYERFGATAFFDAKQKLVRIFWSEHAMVVRPGERHWNHAKWVFKVTFLKRQLFRDIDRTGKKERVCVY